MYAIFVTRAVFHCEISWLKPEVCANMTAMFETLEVSHPVILSVNVRRSNRLLMSEMHEVSHVPM